jgi:cation diffusion facilitator family transporter
MISVLIGYEAMVRAFAPVPIRFAEAIPIASLGLAVNVASAWLLSSGGHHHHHGHGNHADAHGEEDRSIVTGSGTLLLSVFEQDHPPVFRLRAQAPSHLPEACSIETVRSNGSRQSFAMKQLNGMLQSVDTIPEPHAFEARVQTEFGLHVVTFEEHEHAHASAHRDNNMRAAIVHVVADAAVSVLVIIGLVLARAFGWLWMDPLAGLIGACVIASWSYGLIRDTGAILMDMNPDRRTTDGIRQEIEGSGDKLIDLHVWRLGPGHLGAIVSVATDADHDVTFFKKRLSRFRSLSHLTVEIERA